jgi:hypothetical protein
MGEFEFLNKSRKLLRELNWYLLHIGVYLILNMSLVVYIYTNAAKRWPLLFIVVSWALLLIYHGLKINNVHLFKRDRKKVSVLM